MCTAVTYKTKDFYFGRTLDYDFSYKEEVTIAPRNFPLSFTDTKTVKSHYAIIGMAYVVDDYPLYYDAVNEKGLCMAGLNFVGNAVYGEYKSGKENVAQYEFISYLLSRCATVDEVNRKLRNINITNTSFNNELPVASLHWLIADKNKCITVEAVSDGLKIYDNPVGVLTNNPTFPQHIFSLNNYMNLSNRLPENTFSKKLKLHHYSRGMGAIGLPGDLSSNSRFVRAAFVKLNSVSEEGEEESINQFFHILGSVEQQRGCCEVEAGKYETTIYTSCINAHKGIYYYTTYSNHQINAVNMHNEDINSDTLKRYPLINNEKINRQN